MMLLLLNKTVSFLLLTFIFNIVFDHIMHCSLLFSWLLLVFFEMHALGNSDRYAGVVSIMSKKNPKAPSLARLLAG